jgi:hypothetical protein
MPRRRQLSASVVGHEPERDAGRRGARADELVGQQACSGVLQDGAPSGRAWAPSELRGGTCLELRQSFRRRSAEPAPRSMAAAQCRVLRTPDMKARSRRPRSSISRRAHGRGDQSCLVNVADPLPRDPDRRSLVSLRTSGFHRALGPRSSRAEQRRRTMTLHRARSDPRPRVSSPTLPRPFVVRSTVTSWVSNEERRRW